MRTSNKSRSRNKNQNRRSSANVISRVFDSSGPEGKVRGTPQQIIDKYQMLSRDSQLSGDRVAAENFLQHSEHYTRLLNDATREQNQRREQHEAQQAQHAQRKAAQNGDNHASTHENSDQPELAQQPAAQLQPDVQQQDVQQPDAQQPMTVQGSEESGLVETPEGKQRSRRKPKTENTDQAAE
ncbi:MAG: DUF4167 domain-containing protein [Alphaproteobacteria bacterium]|nr:DUF4167 domain-containing protein [Alphaproteobacteria bacterium]